MLTHKPSGRHKHILGLQEEKPEKDAEDMSKTSSSVTSDEGEVCQHGTIGPSRIGKKLYPFSKGIPLVFLFALMGAAVLAYLDAYDWFYKHSRRHEAYELDDIVAFVTLFFVMGLLLLVFHQYKKATLEITRRKEIEESLSRLNAKLEGCVERRTAELKAELEERKRAEERLMENEAQLRLLSSSLLTAEETERKRISRELHDDLGQSLNVLKLQMQSLKGMFRGDQEELRQGCKETLSFVDRIIDDLRRISRDLRPAILEDLGLTTALLSLTEAYAKHSKVEVSLNVQGVDHLFPEESQILIYRIFQEAFANIEKHAAAANILVSFEQEDGVATFIIEDDGKGFDVREARLRTAAGKGMGLAAMDERARMMGGSLIVSSEENSGTKVAFSVQTSPGEAIQ